MISGVSLSFSGIVLNIEGMARPVAERMLRDWRPFGVDDGAEPFLTRRAPVSRPPKGRMSRSYRDARSRRTSASRPAALGPLAAPGRNARSIWKRTRRT